MVRLGVIRLWIGLAIWWFWVGGSVLVVGLGVIQLCFGVYTILVVLLNGIRLLYDCALDHLCVILLWFCMVIRWFGTVSR